MPTPWSNPYDVAIDKNGEAWTGSMLNDRIARLDPRAANSPNISCPSRRTFAECLWTVRRRR